MNTIISPFEQCCSLRPEIFNPEFLSQKEYLNLTETSKFLSKLILKLECDKEISLAKKFTKLLSLYRINRHRMGDFTCFDSCKTMFDIQVVKIKKYVEISLFLHGLNEFDKACLKNASFPDVLPVFKKIIDQLQTDYDVESVINKNLNSPNHKNCRVIVSFLLAIGHFEKASILLKSSFDISKIKNNHKQYSVINAPLLADAGRGVVLRDLFRRSVFKNFKLKSIKETYDVLKTGLNKKLIDSFLRQEADNFLKDGSIAKSIILESIIAGEALPEDVAQELESSIIEEDMEKENTFCKNFILKIEKDGIVNVLPEISCLSDKKLRLKVLHAIVEHFFTGQKVLKWLDHANNKNHDSKRFALLEHLFCGLYQNQFAGFADEDESFHSIVFLNQALHTQNITLAVGVICSFKNKWERWLALYCMADFLHPVLDFTATLKIANEIDENQIRHKFLNYFFAKQSEPEESPQIVIKKLFEILNGDISRVLDFVNVHSDYLTRFYLLRETCKRIEDADLEIQDSLMSINNFEDQKERREMILAYLGK